MEQNKNSNSYLSKIERAKRREKRRQELIAALSEKDNSRSLKKIIADKAFMLGGIIGVFILLMWFCCTTITPLSIFGMMGKADREVYVDTNKYYVRAILEKKDSDTKEIVNITYIDGDRYYYIAGSNEDGKYIFDSYDEPKHITLEYYIYINGVLYNKHDDGKYYKFDGDHVYFDNNSNSIKYSIDDNKDNDKELKPIVINSGFQAITVQRVSAHKAGWVRLTSGVSWGENTKGGVYDFFYTHDHNCITVIGTMGATLFFLVVIAGFIIMITLYGKDLLLIIKTSLYIARQNTKESAQDIKNAINDVRNLYKDDDYNISDNNRATANKDKHSIAQEIQVDKSKKPGRPKGSTTKNKIKPEEKLEENKNYIAINENGTISVNDTVTTQISTDETTGNDDITGDVKLGKPVKFKPETSESNSKPDIDYDDLTTEELDEVVSGKKTLEDIKLERLNNK